MNHRLSKKHVSAWLDQADVHIDGSRPWDIRVHDPRFFDALARSGSLGAGESYIAGWWDCDRLDELTDRILRTDVDRALDRRLGATVSVVVEKVASFLPSRRKHNVADAHYNLDVSMFEQMLGPTMNYSCAYWRNARDLDSAQRDKMELIRLKLDIPRGARVLDIGCGWGGLARHLAEHSSCHVLGITNSRVQADYAAKHTAGLPVDIRLCDYRELNENDFGRFSRIVSVGMFEHVGRSHHHEFFDVCDSLLDDDGLILLQTFGRTANTAFDPWTERHIFPHSYLPSMADMAHQLHHRFILEDWHNFGADYDLTLMAWYRRFETWRREQKPDLDPRFYRMWRYYLMTYAGCFRARTRIQLWQLALSRHGVRGGYQSIRDPNTTVHAVAPRRNAVMAHTASG